MASPFRAFRKYQKTLLAFAGVVLMFVFVLGDPLSQYLGSHSTDPTGNGRAPKDIAVKWSGGKLTNAELGQLVMQRLVLNNFLRQIQGIGEQAAIEAGGDPPPLRVTPLLGAERPEQGVEQDVLRARLFADAARKAGMAISDEYLVDYLMQLGRGYVSIDMIRQIIASNELHGRGASIDFMLDALREEMLARNYLASYNYALETELPEDRWRDWLRVNDRVVVEAVAVTAESRLADVKEPTDAELVAFFDEYKDKEPTPDRDWGIELPSPNPAFKIPQKVATQYLQAEFSQFLAKVEDEVTDEEIEKFYEDNKDPYFIRAESILSAGDDLMEAKDEDAADTTESKPDADEAPVETPADTAPSDDTKPAPATNDESSHSPASPFRLTAFQETSTTESDAAPESESTAAETTAEETAEPEVSSETSDAFPTAELDAPVEKPKNFQPLDEVRDQIRRIIAEAKVTDQLEELMSSVERELNESYMEYFGASVNAEDAGKEPPPPPVALADLTPLAEKNGLVYQKTDPASMLELRDTPIGASVRRDQGNVPFFYSIFGRDVELYQPIATYDLDNNRYVAMKTQDIPGKVPKLDEVRDEVVRAWKLREAGKLALTKAEDLAKKARDAGGAISDAVAGDSSLSVFKTDPFAFFTIGTVSRETQQVQSFRLSEPDGLVAVGPEFMEAVFDLEDGEVAAAPNHDDSIAYVARVAEHQNSLAELQQAFLAEDYNWYGVPAMARGHFITARSAVIADMFKSSDVDWVRDPDQIIGPEDETEADPDRS